MNKDFHFCRVETTFFDVFVTPFDLFFKFEFGLCAESTVYLFTLLLELEFLPETTNIPLPPKAKVCNIIWLQYVVSIFSNSKDQRLSHSRIVVLFLKIGAAPPGGWLSIVCKNVHYFALREVAFVVFTTYSCPGLCNEKSWRGCRFKSPKKSVNSRFRRLHVL